MKPSKECAMKISDASKAVDLQGNSAKKRRVTMKDIAAKTGYTVNTVSHALHDKDDISEAAKQVIKAAAEELGYIGDSMAGSLRTGVTRTVAVIIGDISNPHFAILVKELDEAAAENGYCTIVLNTDENPGKELSAIKTAVAKRVDGIIICPTQKDMANIAYLKELGIPYVLVGRHDGESPAVTMDDRMGGFLATTCLISRGRKRILYLGASECISSEVERREGYCRAMDEGGLSQSGMLICRAENEAKVKVCLEELFKNGECPFDSVVAFSDMYAFETIKVLYEKGIKVPEDVEVIGFDNIQKFMPFMPGISSVEPEECLGNVAFSALLGIISPSEYGAFSGDIVVGARLVNR